MTRAASQKVALSGAHKAIVLLTVRHTRLNSIVILEPKRSSIQLNANEPRPAVTLRPIPSMMISLIFMP